MGEGPALGLSAEPKPAIARRGVEKTVAWRGAPRGRCALRSCHASPISRGCIRSSPSVAGELEVREAESPSGYGWGLWDRRGLGRRVLPGRCLQRLTPPSSASAGEGVSGLGVGGGLLSSPSQFPRASSLGSAPSLLFLPRPLSFFPHNAIV